LATIEEGDLDVILSMALVFSGRYRDLIKIRAKVREMLAESESSRFIHGPVSSVPLYIVKQEQFRRIRELETMEKAGGGIKNG
jgi:hypothetical protein